jgi:hypothetical protein
LVNSEDSLVHFVTIYIYAPTYYLYFYPIFFNTNLLSFFLLILHVSISCRMSHAMLGTR